MAIFGDTSDENNTDSEQILKDLGSGPRPSGLRPPTIRQTAILDSEEDSEEHQVRQLKTLKLREELQDDEGTKGSIYRNLSKQPGGKRAPSNNSLLLEFSSLLRHSNQFFSIISILQ